MKKIQKNSTHQAVIKLKKLISATFCPKKTQTKFFMKKSFESILSLDAVAISCKKAGKFHALIFHVT